MLEGKALSFLQIIDTLVCELFNDFIKSQKFQ
jgi:hypothetical protein